MVKYIVTACLLFLFSPDLYAVKIGDQTAMSGATLDYSGAQELDIPIGLLAAMPAVANPGALYHVTDGSTAIDCTVGGGNVSVLCMHNNGAWVPVVTDDQVAAEVPFTPNGDISATNVQAALVEVRDDAAIPRNNLVTLSGMVANSTNMDTFSGTTIPDYQNTKQALQALETAVEVRNTSPTGINVFTADDCGLVSGMVTGDLCFEY